jgi:hypothetical protein
MMVLRANIGRARNHIQEYYQSKARQSEEIQARSKDNKEN